MLILINICASYICTTRRYSEVPQKIFQILLVWLVPIIGAVSLLVFHWNEKHPKSNPKEFGSGANNSMDTIGGYRSPSSNDSVSGSD